MYHRAGQRYFELLALIDRTVVKVHLSFRMIHLKQQNHPLEMMYPKKIVT